MDQPSPDEAEIDLWSLLVENYEETNFPLSTPDPIEAIRSRLDQATGSLTCKARARSPKS